MSKKEKKAFAPKLRFPEFIDYPDWEKITLSKLLYENKQRNRELKYSREEVLSVSGEYGCVNQIKLLGRSYAGESVKEYRVVETGDIVYTKSPLKLNPFGIIKENKGPVGIVSTLYAVYRTTPEGCSSYIDQYFSGDNNLNNYLQPIVRKGAKNDMKVNNTAVLGGEIIAPKLKEQKKIADFLASLDVLISEEGKKLTALIDHKKGLMQKLFPAEGEAMPEWRFPEFRDCEEWKKEKLSNLCKVIGGGTPSTQISDYWVGEFPWISSSDLTENDIWKINVTRYISEEAIKNSSTKIIEKNSVILVSRVGVGKVAINNFQLCTSQDFTNLTEIEGNPIFFAYYMSNKMLKESKNSQGTSIKGITVDVIKNYLISYPDKPEQQKIANCLSELDILISAQTKKIETLKIHKKALMQGLFPSV